MSKDAYLHCESCDMSNTFVAYILSELQLFPLRFLSSELSIVLNLVRLGRELCRSIGILRACSDCTGLTFLFHDILFLFLASQL